MKTRIKTCMTIDNLRRLLDNYDNGLLTEGEVGGIIFRRVVEQIADDLKKGVPVLSFMSWCSAQPPSKPTLIDAQIIINEAEIRISLR